MPRILIVDDSMFFRKKLAEFLQDAGYRDLLFAANGEEALAILVAQHRSQQPVHLIISDLFMPVLDGVKFRNKVRTTDTLRQIPFLTISGYDNVYTYPPQADLRIDGFMKKSDVTEKLLLWIAYFTAPKDRYPSPKRPNGASSVCS